MKLGEAAALVAIVQTLCPTQKWPEREGAAATAWHLVLGDVSREDAMAAIQAIARRHTGDWPLRIEPTAVRGEVRKVRARRLESAPLPAPAAVDADDTDVPVGRYRANLLATIEAIANGKAVNTVLAIEPGEPPKYVGKPEQWAGEAPIEPRPALDDVKEHLAAVRAQRAPETPRRLPKPLPADEEAAYDAARRILGTCDDLGEAYVEQARQAAKPGTTHVQIMIAAAERVQPPTRKAS